MSGSATRQYIQACARCNSKKIKCFTRSQGVACQQCFLADAECHPRVRKKRKTTAPASQESGPAGTMTGDTHRTLPSMSSVMQETPASSDHIPTDHRDDVVPGQGESTSALHDPATDNSTYINRSHYEGDAPIDESAARDYGQSRQTELSDIEQKTLALWNVYALPPRPVHESLLEAFDEFCLPWMPILEPDDVSRNSSATQSLLLTQAVLLAASRVTPSSTVQRFSTSAEFYQRAKALYWVGHENNPLTVIKALTMLHWYTPDGPAFVSHDTSEYWLKIGVGLAYQVGLHREPPAGPKRALRRRMWWALVVRDALISVSRGRPRAVQLEDSDVAPPSLDDFPDTPSAGELFVAYVDICCTLGDLVQSISRKRVTAAKRSEVNASLFRWTRVLPTSLRLAEYSVASQTYELRPHDFKSRQLHVQYFACIIILSRCGTSHPKLSLAAVFAASFVAGIYEDMLARNLVSRLAPTYTTFGFMAGLVLLSLRPYPALWSAAQPDLNVLLASLQELSCRWRSAIGATKVLQKNMDSNASQMDAQPVPYVSLSREEIFLFEGMPLDLCRMWNAFETMEPPQSLTIEPTRVEHMTGLQQVSSGFPPGLDLEPDGSVFGLSGFDGVPDYFWGDWNIT